MRGVEREEEMVGRGEQSGGTEGGEVSRIVEGEGSRA